jgi:tetratricopeptide (TPR) repeat protein
VPLPGSRGSQEGAWRITLRSSRPTISTALELAAAAKEPITEELKAGALRFLTLAGDRALGIDVEAAERHYARAMELTTEADPERPGILARHADALRQRGRFPDAARAYKDAIEGYRARGDARGLAAAMSRYSVVLWWLGDPRCRPVTAEAIAALESIEPSPELAAALADQAGRSFVMSEHREAIAFAERAIALAAALDLPEPARALGFRGGARAWLGDPEGLQDMRRALEAAEAQGLGREVSVIHLNMELVVWQIEGPRTPLEHMQEGAAFAARRGIEEFVRTLSARTVDLLVHLGSDEEAMAHAEDLIPRLDQAGDVLNLLTVRAAQVRVLTRHGDRGVGRGAGAGTRRPAVPRVGLPGRGGTPPRHGRRSGRSLAPRRPRRDA